jgi:hypothetical protein
MVGEILEIFTICGGMRNWMKSREWYGVKVKDSGLKIKAEVGACVRQAAVNLVVRMSPFYRLPPVDILWLKSLRSSIVPTWSLCELLSTVRQLQAI